MPRNGHKAAVEIDPHYTASVKILNDLKVFWNNESQASGLDLVLYSRLTVVAYTQWAAMLGVDVGMTEEQFIAVCRAQFTEAYKRAPRFS